MRKVLAISCFSILMLLASSSVAEARSRFFFGLNIGGPVYYAPDAYDPGYYYYPTPYAYAPYYSPYYYYPAPAVRFYYAPGYRYGWYRSHGPVVRHYGPRRYYRHR